MSSLRLTGTVLVDTVLGLAVSHLEHGTVRNLIEFIRVVTRITLYGLWIYMSIDIIRDCTRIHRNRRQMAEWRRETEQLWARLNTQARERRRKAKHKKMCIARTSSFNNP